MARSRRWAASWSMDITSPASRTARATVEAAWHSSQPGQPAQPAASRGRGGGLAAASSKDWRSCSSPWPLRAAAPTTGTPSRLRRVERSTWIPFFAASSSKLTHTTTGQTRSSTWSTRARFRSRQVASTTTSVTSASPERR